MCRDCRLFVGKSNGVCCGRLPGKSTHDFYQTKLKRQPRRFYWGDGLQFIFFHRADMVLKRRLYQISFPVIRKNLWMSSSTMAHLGKKPTTYVEVCCSAHYRAAESNNMNFIIQNREVFKLENRRAKALKKMFKFTEFDHYTIYLINCTVDLKYYHLLFHQNLVNVYLINCEIHFETLLKLTPNVKDFIFRGIVPKNWEEKLLEWNRDNNHQNMKYYYKHYYFRVDHVTDFKSLNELIRLKKFKIKICIDAKYDKVQLYKYFKDNNILSELMHRNRLYICETKTSYYPIFFSSWLF